MVKTKKRANGIGAAVVVANVLLICCVVISVMTALSSAEKAAFSQNIENVRTLTDASAEKIELEFLHHTREIQKMANYANNYQGVGMTEEQLCAFFGGLYAVETDVHRWELVDGALNSSAGSARGFDAVTLGDEEGAAFDYNAEAYPQLAEIFCAASRETLGEMHFTSEFTDPSPSLEKVAAITEVIRLRGEDGYQYKTLMLMLNSVYVNDLISTNNDLSTLSYFNYSNIIVDDGGNYVISNAQFQGTNFIDYIALYNDGFQKEDADILKRSLEAEDYADVLYYDNNRGQACAYTIVPVQNSDWHILSIVPLDSFHTEYHFSERFLTFAMFFGLLFIVDITFVASINRQLRHKTKEAQAASEAKMDFLSRMSHDIRTPINVINGMTELAMQEANPPVTKEYLGDIRSSSAFLLGLVNDILDMNKVESGKMELHPGPYTYQEFRSYIHAIISPMCMAKGIEFTMECRPEDIPLSIDKMRLNQILFNLLSNAVKFTPENGHIQLEIAVTPRENGRASVDFSVRDDGIGMSEEFQKTMFSAFSQESRPEEQQILGTGLGLAIVKNLVEIMGGSIRVESAIGKGTTFYVQFETDVTEAPAAQEQENGQLTELNGKRVLLCEDQPMNAKIIVKLLGTRGIKTETAENGKIGVDMLRTSAPDYYDAVLMDVRMPVMNGIDAAKAIRSTSGRDDLRRIPIIALTANAYDSDVRACLDAGMDEHLSKPIEKRLLFAALERRIRS